MSLNVSQLFLVNSKSTACIYSIYCFIAEHLDCFQALVIMNTVAMNILMYYFCGYFSLG